MRSLFGTFLAVALVASSTALAAGDPEAGRAKSAACAACHGADGNSVAPNFPKLAGLGEKYLLKQLFDIRSGARAVPEMAGMLDALSDQDLADLAAFYDRQERVPAGAPEGADLALGERLWRGGNIHTGVPACTGCHAPNGRGNEPAGYPALAGQHAAYVAKQLKDFRRAANYPPGSGGRANDGDAAVMRGVAARLNDYEIDVLAAFIAGLK
ncbi:MAG: cytochrome c4 [Porticoccaceae bacterium]|nr:MAG: cytochrome c4 [Porticoccaceae bacterium]